MLYYVTTATQAKGDTVHEPENLLSPVEVGERLGLATLTVQHRLRTGSLPGFHLGRFWRVREEDLNEYVRKLAAAGEAERQKRAAKAGKAQGRPKKQGAAS